jgi:hypothetical protein
MPFNFHGTLLSWPKTSSSRVISEKKRFGMETENLRTDTANPAILSALEFYCL